MKLIAIIALIVAGFVTQALARYEFTTLDDPSGTGTDAYGRRGTYVMGVSGSDFVGYYIGASGAAHGFRFDGSEYVTLDDTNATGTDYNGDSGTYALGISGSAIVGYYVNAAGGYNGFLTTDGTDFSDVVLSSTAVTTGTTPNGESGVIVAGVSGINLAGSFVGTDGTLHGFLQSGAQFTVLDDPPVSGSATYSGNGTAALGIAGGKVVGYYLDEQGEQHGFVYNGFAFSTVDAPKAKNEFESGGTVVSGVFGANIVGSFTDAGGLVHGFISNGRTFTQLDDPLGANGTWATGLSGSSVAGYYMDRNGAAHGFVARPLQTGKFTLLLTSTSSAGTGFATLTVNGAGRGLMAGQLMDGESFRSTGLILNGTAGDRFVVNARLPGVKRARASSKSLLSGTLTFESLPGSDLDGPLAWTVSGTGTATGPSRELEAVGSVYTPPSGGSSVLPNFSIGTLVLSDSTYTVLSGSAVDEVVTLNSNTSFVVEKPNPQSVKVSIRPSNGLIRGSFIYPGQKKGSAKITTLQGVLFQDQTDAAGYFTGPNGAGSVTIRP